MTETAAPEHPRDRIVRDSFTPAELLLFITVLVFAVVLSWVAAPRSFWALGFCLIGGGFTAFILKTHERTHPFFLDLFWSKFWLISAPAWIVLIQFCAGLLQRPVRTIEVEGAEYATLTGTNPALPISTVTETTWITVLGYVSIYLVVLCLFLVPKSRAFVERILPWLCLNAVVLALFGYLQVVLELSKPLLTRGTGAADFFAYFPYDGHWAAFSLLWSGACVATGLLIARYESTVSFIESTGPWYLTGAILLGASGFLVDATVPAAILLLFFSLLMLLVTTYFLGLSKDAHRVGIASACGLFGTLSFAGGLFRLFQDGNDGGATADLRAAAWQMFSERPLFGWGFDSYGQLLPFFGSDALLEARHERAASDILQLLAEIGVFGLLPILVLIALLSIRYLKGKSDIRLTNHLFIPIIGVCVMAAFDSPFMSPAVVFSFFVILFMMMRWADISRVKVDEVDAKRIVVVTPESERGVPVFTGEYNDEEK